MQRRFALAAFPAVVILSTLAYAQPSASGEVGLRRYLEGKQVVSRIDMPATRAGINVYPERTTGTLDSKQQQKLIQKFGVAVPIGQASRITRVWASKNMLVVELDGGGVISDVDWEDAESNAVPPSPTPKSDRELSLERQISSENDGTVVASLRGDLDVERRQRLRQDELNNQQYDETKRRIERDIAAERLHAGSRLNLVFEKTNIAKLSPDQVLGALRKYVDFAPAKAAH